MKQIKNYLLLVILLILFVGCGAKSELEDRGIAYSQENYFKYGVYKKDIPVIELFYDAGMAVDTKDDEGKTALYYAIYYNNPQLFKLLVEKYGAEVTNNDRNFFSNYRYKGRETDNEILNTMIDNGVKFHPDNLSKFINYTLNTDSMDTKMPLIIVDMGIDAKKATWMLSRIYKNFAYYVNRERKFRKTPFEELTKKAKDLQPLVEKLLENGADIKKAFSDFQIQTYQFSGNKNDWILELTKFAVESGKIDLNKDNGIHNNPIIEDVVFGTTTENINNILQYLVKNGAKPTHKTMVHFCMGYSGTDKAKICEPYNAEAFIKHFQ